METYLTQSNKDTCGTLEKNSTPINFFVGGEGQKWSTETRPLIEVISRIEFPSSEEFREDPDTEGTLVHTHNKNIMNTNEHNMNPQ